MTRTTDERTTKPAPPATLVIFGAMGDLTRRLLVPAMINMTRLGLADEGLRILGIGIEPGDDAALVTELDGFQPEAGGEGAVTKGRAWTALRKRIAYVSGDFTKDEVYAAIAERIGDGNAAFYLAIPPRFFGDVVDKLAAHGLTRETDKGFRRIAIEKPFGHDLESARALNHRILAHVDEKQVYRVDHFLGKETVQNILVARFANMMMARLWTSDAIDSVQITAAETVGVGTRGKFYEAAGALRDMVPNHLFTMLAMVAMEPPNSLDPEAIRDEKGKVLKAIRRWSPDEARANGVRGAYTAGTAGGKRLKGYRETPDVAKDSDIETYVALRLMVDTWRWAGVPFYLRTGKAMTVRDTEIVIDFKPVPAPLFCADGVSPPPNRLVIQVQPDEGLRLDMQIKEPGLEVTPVPIALDFHYADRFEIETLVGYEPLLYDLFAGDQTLFQRADGIEAGWAAVQPFLDAWAEDGTPESYAAGSLGPKAADALLEREGRAWHTLSEELSPRASHARR